LAAPELGEFFAHAPGGWLAYAGIPAQHLNREQCVRSEDCRCRGFCRLRAWTSSRAAVALVDHAQFGELWEVQPSPSALGCCRSWCRRTQFRSFRWLGIWIVCELVDVWSLSSSLIDFWRTWPAQSIRCRRLTTSVSRGRRTEQQAQLWEL